MELSGSKHGYRTKNDQRRSTKKHKRDKKQPIGCNTTGYLTQGGKKELQKKTNAVKEGYKGKISLLTALTTCCRRYS